MIEISPEKRAELENFLIQRFQDLYDKKKFYDERVLKWIKQYSSIPEDTKQDWETNIFIPYTFSQIASAKPRIRHSLFPQHEPFLNIEAKNPDFENSEKPIRDMLMSELREMKFERVVKGAIHSVLPETTAFLKVSHDGAEGIFLSQINFFDVICDFSMKGPESNAFQDIFHRIETTETNLKIMADRGVYCNVEEALKTDILVDEILQNQMTAISYYMNMAEMNVDPKKYKSTGAYRPMELLEWWGKYDINDDGIDEDIVATICNRTVLVRVDENAEKKIPIFAQRIYKRSGLTFGVGMCQMFEGLQYELNEKRNQRMDYLNLLLKPILKARRTSDIDWDQLFASPDNVLQMDDPHNDLLPMEMGRLPLAAYQEDGQLKSDMQYAGGSLDYSGSLRGLGATETATGMSIITSEGATRFRDYLDDFAEDLMDLVKYIAYMIKKYKPMERKIRLFDSHDWRHITKEEIMSDYDITMSF